EVEEVAHESAERTARQGASLAMSMGLRAESPVVPDARPVADTLIRVARENDAPAVVVGAHRHGGLSEALLGSTSRDVVPRAARPGGLGAGGDGEERPARG